VSILSSSVHAQRRSENRTRPAWSSQYLNCLKYYGFRTQALAGVKSRDHSTEKRTQTRTLLLILMVASHLPDSLLHSTPLPNNTNNGEQSWASVGEGSVP
jgi:hypothetical protein